MPFTDFFARVEQDCLASPPHPVLLEVLRRGIDLFRFPEEHQVHPLIDKYFSALDASIRGIVASQLPNGSWQDFEGDLRIHVEFLADYWTRPFLLAMGFANPRSGHYQNAKLLTRLEAALRRGRVFVSPDFPRWANWWACDIGFPLHVTSTLLIASPFISKNLRMDLLRDLYFKGYAPQSIGFGGAEGTGANAAWVAINTLRLAALSNNWDLAVLASTIMKKHSRVVHDGFGEGIMPDGSFHQHGNGLNMGYGESYLESVTQFISMTAGTELALPPDILADVKLFAEFCAWASFRGTTDIFTKGRAASRDGELHDYVTPFAVLRHAGGHFFQDLVEAFFSGRPTDTLPASSHFPETPALHARFAHLLSETGSGTPLRGARAFPYSGYLVCRSPSHFVSVQCTDENLKSWESIHHENLKGYYEKEGAIFFLTPETPLTPATQYQRPWGDRMGVTRLEGACPVAEQYGQSTIVRCDVVNNAGVCGVMHRQRLPRGGTLLARKTYVVWENCLFQMASDVHVAGGDMNAGSIPPCATALLTIPLLRFPEGGHLAGKKLSAESWEDLGGSPRLLPQTFTGLVGNIAFAVRDTPSMEAQVVRCDYDPRTINEIYPPSQRPQPVDWLVLRCRHSPPQVPSRYQCLCAFATTEKDFENSLSGSFPVTYVTPEEHRIEIPGVKGPFVVNFTRSLFSEILKP